MTFASETLRYLTACGLFLGYVLFCGWTWWNWRRKHHLAAIAPLQTSGKLPILVVFASQTGVSEWWAQRSAAILATENTSVQICALNQLNSERLTLYRHVFFLISTYGEGTAPDNARTFADHYLVAPNHLATPGAATSLTHLNYAILAFGDSTFTHFCQFAKHLNQWLMAQGAQSLFERIEVDNSAPDALNLWQEQLTKFAAQAPLLQVPNLIPPPLVPTATPHFQNMGQWHLRERHCCNSGSLGNPIFHLVFTTDQPSKINWKSGDCVQIAPPTDPTRLRSYSISSIVEDREIHLLVRLHQQPNGQPGHASHWLTQQLPMHAAIDLRIAPQPHFQLGNNIERPLILIGNGVGIAALRSHIKVRAQNQTQSNWLIFGERQAAHDFLFQDEIKAWQKSGVLKRVDLAFSRDQTQRHYVQNCLHHAATELSEWIKQGAAIYVCGSLHTMARDVHATLTQLLGEATLLRLRQEQRYLRDVF